MLPTENIIQDIYSFYESKEKTSLKRTHLGASVIGDRCKRAIFYEFRWYYKEGIEGRILRLFDTGKREEERVLDNLLELGFKFRKGKNGDQIRFKDTSGHIGGSVDGIIDHIPAQYGDFGSVTCILEIKNHSEKNFRKLQKEKVQGGFPKHFHQMQYYMGSMEIPLSLYIAVNKNTDEIYMEFVEYDAFGFHYLKSKAEGILVAEEVPPKISENPSWFECKMCKFYPVCHLGVEADKNCRSCKNSVVVEGGKWGCKLLNCNLNYEQQIAGCDQYELRK